MRMAPTKLPRWIVSFKNGQKSVQGSVKQGRVQRGKLSTARFVRRLPSLTEEPRQQRTSDDARIAQGFEGRAAEDDGENSEEEMKPAEEESGKELEEADSEESEEEAEEKSAEVAEGKDKDETKEVEIEKKGEEEVRTEEECDKLEEENSEEDEAGEKEALKQTPPEGKEEEDNEEIVWTETESESSSEEKDEGPLNTGGTELSPESCMEKRVKIPNTGGILQATQWRVLLPKGTQGEMRRWISELSWLGCCGVRRDKRGLYSASFDSEGSMKMALSSALQGVAMRTRHVAWLSALPADVSDALALGAVRVACPAAGALRINRRGPRCAQVVTARAAGLKALLAVGSIEVAGWRCPLENSERFDQNHKLRLYGVRFARQLCERATASLRPLLTKAGAEDGWQVWGRDDAPCLLVGAADVQKVLAAVGDRGCSEEILLVRRWDQPVFGTLVRKLPKGVTEEDVRQLLTGVTTVRVAVLSTCRTAVVYLPSAEERQKCLALHQRAVRGKRISIHFLDGPIHDLRESEVPARWRIALKRKSLQPDSRKRRRSVGEESSEKSDSSRGCSEPDSDESSEDTAGDWRGRRSSFADRGRTSGGRGSERDSFGMRGGFGSERGRRSGGFEGRGGFGEGNESRRDSFRFRRGRGGFESGQDRSSEGLERRGGFAEGRGTVRDRGGFGKGRGDRGGGFGSRGGFGSSRGAIGKFERRGGGQGPQSLPAGPGGRQ